MRQTLSKGLLIGALCILTCGCGSLFTASNKEKVSNIRPGMSQNEVQAILGKPDYTRFNGGIEQWEYRNCYYAYGNQPVNVTVDFSNGKVIAMDSFDTPVYPTHPTPPKVVCPPSYPNIPTPGRHTMTLNEKQFNTFYKRMKEEPFEDDRLKLLKEETERTDFTCGQCARLLQLNSFDDDKLTMLRVLAPAITDKENLREILDTLTFDSSKQKAMQLLRN